jgi:hypothetical protein
MRTFAVTLSLFACLPTWASAQATATATSGSPARISHIRTEAAAIDRQLRRYRQSERVLDGFSAEGGRMVAYLDGRAPRKVAATLFGETWRGTEEFFYEGDRLIFAFIVTEVYGTPQIGPVLARIEHRLYLENDTLIRRVRSQKPSRTAEDLTFRDPTLADVLTHARTYLGCAKVARQAPCAAGA